MKPISPCRSMHTSGKRVPENTLLWISPLASFWALASFLVSRASYENPANRPNSFTLSTNHSLKWAGKEAYFNRDDPFRWLTHVSRKSLNTER